HRRHRKRDRCLARRAFGHLGPRRRDSRRARGSVCTLAHSGFQPRQLQREILGMRSLLIPLCLLTTAAVAAPPSDIDTYIERAIRTFEVPGMAVCVVESGETTLAKGYGVRKVGTHDAVDAHTLFPIASNSKAFTAAAL